MMEDRLPQVSSISAPPAEEEGRRRGSQVTRGAATFQHNFNNSFSELAASRPSSAVRQMKLCAAHGFTLFSLKQERWT